MSNNNQGHSNQNRYGMLSMIGIIVGTVMGSGIFIKNQSLMNDSQSVILTSIAWIIGGIVVISMMLAFVEVSSITKLKNEQGTFTNWSRRLWGENFSKFVGVYFTLIYFPLVISSEVVYAGQKLTEMSFLTGIEDAGAMSGFVQGPWLNWYLITLIAFAILAFSFIINILWVKPGKAFTSTISIVKVIPLLSVVLAFVLVVGGLTVGDISEINPIFDAGNEQFNGGLDGVLHNFSTILLIMPGVMFAFDGFLYANSMSTETKTPNTYKNAAIISIGIITTLYLSFSLATFAVAQTTDAGEVNYTIGAIFASMFPGFQVIADILVFMIFLSITSATFGYAISSQWSFADASEGNLLKDVNGHLIRRNRAGNPYKAGWLMFAMSFVAVVFFRISDLTTIVMIADTGIGADLDNVHMITQYATPMTDFISDTYTLLNFALYSVMILGAMINRKSRRNEVEEVKGFFVFASIALAVVGLTTIVFGYDVIFAGIIQPIFNGLDADGVKSVSKVIVLTCLITIYLITLWYVWTTTGTATENEKGRKQVFRHAYEHHVPYHIFKEAMDHDYDTCDRQHLNTYSIIDEETKYIEEELHEPHRDDTPETIKAKEESKKAAESKEKTTAIKKADSDSKETAAKSTTAKKKTTTKKETK